MIRNLSLASNRKSNYVKELEFLSRSSIYLLKNSSAQKLFRYVSQNLFHLTGAGISVSEYDPLTNSIIVRAIHFSGSQKNIIERILGLKVLGMTLPFDESTRKKFNSGKLSKVSGGLYELCFKRIPEPACLLIERTLHIGDIYAMAFVVEKDFIGTIALITRKDSKFRNFQLVEAFVNQCAVALKRIKTEEQLLETKHVLETEKARLIELEQKKDEFFGIASHELKTPLTTVKAYAQLLEKNLPSELDKPHSRAQRYVSRLLSEVERIEALVNDMLDVNKIVQGKLTYHQHEFELNSLIEDVIHTYTLISPKRTVIKEGKSDKKIRADENRIRQVMINLLSNADKYSQSARKILVVVRDSATEIIVGVRDFGIGIPAASQGNIFKLYYRVSERVQGFGLGLYLSSEIIKRHGGRMWFESKEGKGSTFYFSLPVMAEAG